MPGVQPECMYRPCTKIESRAYSSARMRSSFEDNESMGNHGALIDMVSHGMEFVQTLVPVTLKTQRLRARAEDGILHKSLRGSQNEEACSIAHELKWFK